MLHVPGSLEKFYVATKASCDTPTGYMYLVCDWKVEQLVVLQLAVVSTLSRTVCWSSYR